jgi:large subunit ribosomal protein L1
MPKLTKHQQRVAEVYDREKVYDINEAITVAQELKRKTFDETVELHMRLNVDPRHADQQVRGTVSLPHGTGRTTRVVVFAEGESEKLASEAGADEVGGEALAKRIKDGWMDFDAVVATQPMMRVVGRLGPVLGPRGLMPSPKAGTVVSPEDVGEVVSELKAGRIEFRVDKTANIHVPVGKASFEAKQLSENAATVIGAVVRARPPAVKGQYVKSTVIATAMGPGLKIDLASALAVEAEE